MPRLALILHDTCTKDLAIATGDFEGPLEGKYANFLKVGQNAYELIIEFGQLYQTEEAPRMHTRIVTSLAYAQDFVETLQRALLQHERSNQGTE